MMETHVLKKVLKTTNQNQALFRFQFTRTWLKGVLNQGDSTQPSKMPLQTKGLKGFLKEELVKGQRRIV